MSSAGWGRRPVERRLVRHTRTPPARTRRPGNAQPSAYLELRPDLGPVACPGHLSAGSAASARRAVVRLARYGGASSCRLAGPTVSSLAAAGVTRFQATSTGAEITAHATLGTVSRRRLLAVVVTAGSRGHGTALGYAAVSCHLLIVSTFSTSDLETLARILGR